MMMDVGSLIREAAATLRAAAVDSPEFDAKALLAHTCGCEVRDIDKAMLLGREMDSVLAEQQRDDAARLLAMFHRDVARRAKREPLQHITGHAPFRYLDMQVGPGVFIPRPETETVVQDGLDWLASQSLSAPRIVDLCAGSGAIGLAAVTEIASAEIWAVELNASTLEWTKRNCKQVADNDRSVDGRYHLVQGDATDSDTLRKLDGTVDLVISNPPYIPLSEIPEQPEARDHDPEQALYGGSADGLLIPERIIDRSVTLLRAGGCLVMEHDISQGQALVDYAMSVGFEKAVTGLDYTGRPRFLHAEKT